MPTRQILGLSCRFPSQIPLEFACLRNNDNYTANPQLKRKPRQLSISEFDLVLGMTKEITRKHVDLETRVQVHATHVRIFRAMDCGQKKVIPMGRRHQLPRRLFAPRVTSVKSRFKY